MSEYIIYLLPVNTEDQVKVCIFRRSLTFRSYGTDYHVRMRAIISLFAEWELGVSNHQLCMRFMRAFAMLFFRAVFLTVMPLFSDITDFSITGRNL